MANRHTKGSVTSAVIRETKPRGGPPTSPRGGPGPERRTTARAGKSADTPKASWAARGDATRRSCSGEQHGKAPRDADSGLPCQPAMPLRGVRPREREIGVQAKTWT